MVVEPPRCPAFALACVGVVWRRPRGALTVLGASSRRAAFVRLAGSRTRGAAGSVFPDAVEPGSVHPGVASGVVDVAVPEVSRKRQRIHALVHELEACSVTQ